MARLVLYVFLLLFPVAAYADAVLAQRTIRPREVIAAPDLAMAAQEIPGALRALDAAVGQEAVTTIYAGQPVRAHQIASPAAVERNDLVELIYQRSGLHIRAEGRALGRGPIGARIRVMNTGSRNAVTGTVVGMGRVAVN